MTSFLQSLGLQQGGSQERVMGDLCAPLLFLRSVHLFVAPDKCL